MALIHSRARALALRTVATALLLAAVGASGACAPPSGAPGPAAEESGPPPVATVPLMLSVRDLVLPIEPYLFTDRQIAGVLRARGKLAAVCMERYGHSWPAPSGPSGETGTLNPANTAHRYGLTSAAVAARHGYHPAGDTVLRPRAKDRGPRPVPAAMRVLTGFGPDGSPVTRDPRGRAVPPGGCLGEATAALSGDPDRIGNRELVGEINIGSYQRSRRDPRVRAVFRAWSRCMAARGYDYPDPVRVPGAGDRAAGPVPSRTEIALAVADVECKRTTNVVGVWSAVDAAYQRRAMGERRSELAAVARDIRTQLANAERVLADR
ncbi:hypothetical protein ABT354_25790 [Streptomyces sp. NPDC000594]|uniref:hypothetical protein n=1 Tax=Streptomyces sp. NPDC000594 TaxID=3154261 RepID=UPI003320ECD5